MSWFVLIIFGGLLLCVGWLDPRRLPRGGELGQAMRRVSRRDRREVRQALREGRAVHDSRLASLAASLARDEMRRVDYRGPLLAQEKAMIVLGIAGIALALAVGFRHLRQVGIELLGSGLVIVWVTGLRRVTPAHRHATDPLRAAYQSNLALTRRSGVGVIDQLQLDVEDHAAR